MPNFTYDPFEHASHLQHFVYDEQHEFDKELIKAFAIEFEKGTQNTRDGRPQIGTLKAIAPIICNFRYTLQRGEFEGAYNFYFRYSRNRSHVSAFNTGYTNRINRVIEHLDRLGYIIHFPSERNSDRQSRFKFTPLMAEILKELKPKDIIDPLDNDKSYSGVLWTPEHEIYVKPWVRRQYSPQGRPQSDIRRVRARLGNSPYKRTIANDLRAHNDYLEGVDIKIDTNSLNTPEKQRLYKQFEKRFPPSIRRKRLFRLFFNNALTQYGRFHKGWWQFLNSSLRPHLLINDENTVELDYGGLQPNILFSLNQVDVGDNYDPYKIENKNRGNGEERYHYRPLVKKCFMFIANGRTPERYLTSVKGNLTRDINGTPIEERNSKSYQKKVSLREQLNDEDYCDRFKEDLKHAWLTIWDNFEEEAYLWRHLTIKETEITNNIHNRMRALDIPVLSIHDSYIVPINRAQTLRDVMVEEFQNVLSVNRIPLIKEEGLETDIRDELTVIEFDDYYDEIS
ncbi:MAG: hypothetical protein CMH25_05415 [Micavibrio sp.]|nr:hypothetical protein [Micavibrio sp.]|tara:strand:- start:3271 stop:4800 length:1530 start_codon:yes stop_codon:yes gene_type:complete